MINNNSENEDIKNIFLKEEFENEELKNQKLININLNKQYIEDMFENEQYNNNNFYIIQNKCGKCNKNNKEKGFDLCKLCINEMLDNECIVKYLICIEQYKIFDIKNIKFEYDYSFDELFKFSKYYPNIENYIDYIKSKICANCKNIMKKSHNQLRCGCYQCEKCYNKIQMNVLICCYCSEIKRRNCQCTII